MTSEKRLPKPKRPRRGARNLPRRESTGGWAWRENLCACPLFCCLRAEESTKTVFLSSTRNFHNVDSLSSKVEKVPGFLASETKKAPHQEQGHFLPGRYLTHRAMALFYIPERRLSTSKNYFPSNCCRIIPANFPEPGGYLPASAKIEEKSYLGGRTGAIARSPGRLRFSPEGHCLGKKFWRGPSPIPPP